MRFRSKKTDADETVKKRRNIVLTPSSLVLATYILLFLTKILDVAFINRENEYYSVVILQLMIFMLPGAIWCKWSGDSYVKGLRLRLPRFDTILLIFSGTLLMISGGLLLSTVFGSLESLSNNFSLYDTFISKSDGSLPSNLYLFVAYAILPAICESGDFLVCFFCSSPFQPHQYPDISFLRCYPCPDTLCFSLTCRFDARSFPL